MKISALATALFVSASSAALAEPNWHRTPTGIAVTPRSGSEAALRLEVYGDGIIRVTSGPTHNLNLPSSLMVTAKPLTSGFTVTEAPGFVTLKTAKGSAQVGINTGHVSFRDANGRAVLSESGAPVFTPATAEGVPFLTVTQQFNRGTDEGFYGLGQHQNAQMNYLGEDVELAQHNMDVAIPFVVSTRNYGLLWDNNSITRFGNPKPYSYAGRARPRSHGHRQAGRPASPHITGWRQAGRHPAGTGDRLSIYPRPGQMAGRQANAREAGHQPASAQGRLDGHDPPRTAGPHKFQLYASSYFKLFVDGKPVLDIGGGRTGIPGTTMSSCR